MENINNTSELIEIYNLHKEKILKDIKQKLKGIKSNMHRYSAAYCVVQQEILNHGYKISNCQCNKLAYLALEEIRKEGE